MVFVNKFVCFGCILIWPDTGLVSPGLNWHRWEDEIPHRTGRLNDSKYFIYVVKVEVEVEVFGIQLEIRLMWPITWPEATKSEWHSHRWVYYRYSGYNLSTAVLQLCCVHCLVLCSLTLTFVPFSFICNVINHSGSAMSANIMSKKFIKQSASFRLLVSTERSNRTRKPTGGSDSPVPPSRPSGPRCKPPSRPGNSSSTPAAPSP